jgi:E3 ubiquitin-protein ligase HERC4
VLGPWGASNADQNLMVRRIFAGGDHCFASLVNQSEGIAPEDFRLWSEQSQIWYLTLDLAQKCAAIQSNETVDLDLISSIEIIFKHLSCINASFLLENNKHFCCTSRHHGVDVEKAEKAFDFLRKVEHENLKQLIWESVTNDLIKALIPNPADVETLRIYLILPLYHEFINSKNFLRLHTPFAKALLGLEKIPFKIISNWFASQSLDYFEKLVNIFKETVKYLLHFQLNKIRNANNQVSFLDIY